MFPKKKPAVTVAIGVGKPKTSPKPSFGGGGPKPAPHSPDDLESPDPVEGKDDSEESDSTESADAGMLAGGDDATPPDAGLGAGYGAKLEKDIESVGAALGMDAGQAKKAAGAFFMTAAQCLMGGGEGDDDQGQSDGDEMIDTDQGAPMRGRYGQ